MSQTAPQKLTNQPTPEKVMQIATGGWAASILATAARYGIFNVLEGNPGSAEKVAENTGISLRGAQALLDGLTGLGLLSLSAGGYQNTPDASLFLVKGKPSYLGAFAEVLLNDFGTWQKMPETVKTGLPSANDDSDVPDNPFWQQLVPAIAALSHPVAQMAAEKLALAKAGPVSWLDVGGGSGIFSAVWLAANKEGHAFQLDWPNVNKLAREFVGNFGVGDRFETIDGDFHTSDFGSTKYDYAIYSHIAHMEPPEGNIQVFRKFRKALKPGGTLMINDFVLSDGRMGHPFAMLFASQMVLMTKAGFTYRQADYREWLHGAGFKSVEIVPTLSPSTLVFAR
ncbi:MAG TPA: class I SAM-dependent methyltransferase [Candidatus Acidoferrales bacterium]|nr:class I SAM-dependent methyltransferase [Candidatus Acidoferrales bacterium]